jgi:hypothetical protein
MALEHPEEIIHHTHGASIDSTMYENPLFDVSRVAKVTGKDLAKAAKEMQRKIGTFAKWARIGDESVERLVIREKHDLPESANLPGVDTPKAKPFRCWNDWSGRYRFNVKRLED